MTSEQAWPITEPELLERLRLDDAGFAEMLRDYGTGLGRRVYEPDVPFPPSYEGVYRHRRRVSGWQLYEALGVERGCSTRTSSI